MKAEHANPFITAAIKTFKQELNVELKRSSISVKNAPAPTKDITIIIGVTGPVKGQVVYSMDQNVAMEITKSMLPGKLPAELKKLLNSAVSEMANIMTGQASIALAGENSIIEITPPTVFCGGGVTMDFLAMKTICLTFISEIGSVEVNIALAEE